MGRRKHNPKMVRMSEVFAKHGQHKHMAEVARIWNDLGEQARKRRRQRAPVYGSVEELMRREGR